MGQLSGALLIVLGINVLFFLGQVSLANINPGVSFYNVEGSLICDLESNGCQNSSYSIDDTNPGGKLPQSTGSVNVETGNVFTDTWTAIKNWLLKDLGLGYLFMILSGPYTFLKVLKLPVEIVWAFGSLWYGFTLFLLINWLKGGDG